MTRRTLATVASLISMAHSPILQAAGAAAAPAKSKNHAKKSKAKKTEVSAATSETPAQNPTTPKRIDIWGMAGMDQLKVNGEDSIPLNGFAFGIFGHYRLQAGPRFILPLGAGYRMSTLNASKIKSKLSIVSPLFVLISEECSLQVNNF